MTASARAGAQRLAEVGALEVLVDVLERDEEEHPVALDGAAHRSAELFAMKVGGRRAVRGVRRQALQTLEVEQAAVQVVGARLRDDVDDAAGGAAELRVGPAGHDLELLDRLQRDVDRRALAAELFAEESVVVVAAIEADVVVHAALPIEGDLVAVRPLDDADAGSEGEQILELAAEDRRRADGGLVERVADFGAGHVDERGAGHRDRLRGPRHLQHGIDGDRLPHREGDVLLHVCGEPLQAHGHSIAARRKLEGDEAAVSAGGQRAHEIGIDIPDLDRGARDHRAGRIGDGALDDAGCNLRLARGRYGKDQSDPDDQRDLSRHGDSSGRRRA